MSLTSFLNQKDVKEKFRKEFLMPRFKEEKPLLAPPKSRRYSLVGTAFDYLMRFHLKRLNPEAITYPWIAESSLTILSPILEDIEIDADTKHITYKETEQTENINQIIKQAKVYYKNYLFSGLFDNKLIKSSLQLAQLDIICRANIVDENLGTTHQEDIEDLRSLLSLIKPELFKTPGLCLLNPGFGDASKLVGGADADILIDDTIVDIKTTKNLQLKRDDFNQLLGYVVLNEISAIGSLNPRPRISKVAIYFSRHGYLHIFDLNKIINIETFSSFINWFSNRAKHKT